MLKRVTPIVKSIAAAHMTKTAGTSTSHPAPARLFRRACAKREAHEQQPVNVSRPQRQRIAVLTARCCRLVQYGLRRKAESQTRHACSTMTRATPAVRSIMHISAKQGERHCQVSLSNVSASEEAPRGAAHETHSLGKRREAPEGDGGCAKRTAFAPPHFGTDWQARVPHLCPSRHRSL